MTRDPSLWVLVVSNVYTLGAALYQGWDIRTIMLIYWAQSVIIGFFTVLRILSLKNFSTTGLRVNRQSVQPTRSTRMFLAGFFAFHFGFFHVGYLIFIFVGGFFGADGTPIALGGILSITLLFFLNHLFSFFYNFKDARERPRNVGKVMLMPYARIVPMHITIIVGGVLFLRTGSSVPMLALFLILKTVADALMHIHEHKPDAASLRVE